MDAWRKKQNVDKIGKIIDGIDQKILPKLLKSSTNTIGFLPMVLALKQTSLFFPLYSTLRRFLNPE